MVDTSDTLQLDLFTIEDSTLINSAVAGRMDGVYCQYRSKQCWNLRALKQNGALHKLCEFHRDRANVNQRRLEQRRRARRGVQPMAHGSIGTLPVEYDTKFMQAMLAIAPMVAPTYTQFDLGMVPAAMTLCWSELASAAEIINLDSNQSCVLATTGELSPTPSVGSPVDVNFVLNNFEILEDELLELQ